MCWCRWLWRFCGALLFSLSCCSLIIFFLLFALIIKSLSSLSAVVLLLVLALFRYCGSPRFLCQRSSPFRLASSQSNRLLCDLFSHRGYKWAFALVLPLSRYFLLLPQFHVAELKYLCRWPLSEFLSPNPQQFNCCVLPTESIMISSWVVARIFSTNQAYCILSSISHIYTAILRLSI